jgi:hypothetical protein
MAVIRGDVGFGNEPVMREAERRRQPYLFKLRLTKGVKRAIERAMGEQDWQTAGAGWQVPSGRPQSSSREGMRAKLTP